MKKLITVTGLAAAVLAGCATAPQRNDQLEQARVEVQTLTADPLAQQAAASDLDAARASLNQADTAFQKKRPPDEVNQLAYLAMRHAQAGEARISEARSRQEMARAQEDRTRIQLQAREQEARKAKAETEATQAELANARREITDLQAKQTDRGLVMTLNDVLFDTGRATLKPGADRDMDRLARALKDNSNTRVIIEGHTDSVGGDEYNQALSERRAESVAMALRERGVPPDRYEVRGLGKEFPIASNATAEGRQQNRRVEVVFSDESGRFAQGEKASSSSR
ncbi:MAG TPA: OmpA family protein [Steroidobacteraceae bacterium]|nr:OmpA family protein [Steroidobacteraceae bacterium]